MLPTPSQQQAINAKLNYLLGAELYDQYFAGFECGSVVGDTLQIYAPSQDHARVLEEKYSWHIAVVVESIIKRPVRRINALPKNL